jgi:hypothetical protein
MVAEITSDLQLSLVIIWAFALMLFIDIKLSQKTGTREKLLLKDISILDKYEYGVVVELVF